MSEVEFGGAKVRDVMGTEPPLLEQTANVCKVARLLRSFSHLWIVPERGSRQVLGVVTERDFLDLLSPIPDREYATGLIRPRSLYHEEMSSAEEFMSSPVVSCEGGTSVADALELLREKRIRHLAVVENGEIVGELSLKGIIAAYYKTSCGMLDS
jgi:CBS domain-containing protein